MNTHASTDLVIDVSARKVRWVLLLITLGLGVASVIIQVARVELDIAWPGTNLLDANMEANFPTLFSTGVLVLACLLLAEIGLTERKTEASRRWLALSGLFALAAVDEASGLHELLNDPLRSLLNFGNEGVLSFPWIIAGFVVVVAFAAYFRSFVGGLPPYVRRRATLGALVYVLGALVLEGLETQLGGAVGSKPSLLDEIVGTLSELCEMVGVVLIVDALLLYIAQKRDSVFLAIKTRV